MDSLTSFAMLPLGIIISVRVSAYIETDTFRLQDHIAVNWWWKQSKIMKGKNLTGQKAGKKGPRTKLLTKRKWRYCSTCTRSDASSHPTAPHS